MVLAAELPSVKTAVNSAVSDHPSSFSLSCAQECAVLNKKMHITKAILKSIIVDGWFDMIEIEAVF